MTERTLDNLVLRSDSVVSLNERFSQVLGLQDLCKVKREPHLQGLCCDVEVVENRTVLPRKSVKQRLGRVNPGVQLGPRPQRVSLDSRPSGRWLSSGPLEGQFLGGQRCPCALWGLRLLSRRYGWAGRALRARPLNRTGFAPNKTKKLGPFGGPGFRRCWAEGVRETGSKQEFRRQAKVPTKEELDQQLDDYMSMSKRCLDNQLDAYMAMAGEDDGRWFDIDRV